MSEGHGSAGEEFEAELEAALSAQQAEAKAWAQAKVEAQELGKLIAARLQEAGSPVQGRGRPGWYLWDHHQRQLSAADWEREIRGIAPDGVWIECTTQTDSRDWYWNVWDDWPTIVRNRARAMEGLAKRLAG